MTKIFPYLVLTFFVLTLMMISRMRIEASPYYFVKHDKTQKTELKNVLESSCYAWTCNSRNELSTCTNQGCLLASKNLTVPKELRHAKEIHTVIKTYVNYCGGNSYNARRCIPAMFVTVTMTFADSSNNLTYADSTYYDSVIEESFLAPNWSAAGASNSNNFSASHQMVTSYSIQNRWHASINSTLASIRIAIQPYKFCGRISDVYTFTDACLNTVTHLVEFPLSAAEGSVNGTCVANASPVNLDMKNNKELYAICQPKDGYIKYSGVCSCNKGYTIANDNTSCQGMIFKVFFF